MVNHQLVAVNSAFARQVLFLSQRLDCSERYIADLLHVVMGENPNAGSINCLELTIAEFHRRRRHLVDVLRYILEAAEAASARDAPPVYARIDAFVRQNLIPAVMVSGGEITLANRIFCEIRDLGSVASTVQEERRGAGTTSSDQGSWNFIFVYALLHCYKVPTLRWVTKFSMQDTTPSSTNDGIWHYVIASSHDLDIFLLTTSKWSSSGWTKILGIT
jgi:Nuclear pore complex scaffold, nucleoporins 186/192/205